MLQLMCRKRRNQTLISCYGSLQCKARSMRSCLYIWRQRTLLATSLDALASYAFKKKFILAWRKRGQLVQKQLFLQRRAGLRWALNRQRFALHQWYRNITQERHCRYSLRVFRKLHPVPAVSIIKRVFLAWKYEYTQFRKEQKKVFRQVVSIRKTCTKKRFLSAWFDTFECCSVNKRQMLRAMKALYKLSARRKWSIQQLSNALILHTSAPRMHSLRAFLVAKGLMIHTRVEQEYFHTLCFVRKYMHLWREYSVTRRQQSVQYHRAYKTAVRQCSYHFACAYRTHNKHRKWVQWRGLKCWYQLLVKRRNAYASLSTRLWAKQFFYRWMEQYNRKLINYHLQIPSVSVILSPVPPVSQNNHTNSDSRCTDLSCMAHNNTTLQSTFMDTTCATFQSAADRQQKQGHAQGQGHLGAAAAAAEYSTMAVDTSMHVLQYHPSYSRQLQNQRLHSLSRDSRDSGGVRVGGEQLGNLSAISHSSSVHSPIGIFKSSTTGRVLRQAAPRYGKLIEPTRAVPMGLGLSTGNISTSSRVAAQKKPVTLYDKKTPFAQRQRRVAERGAMDLSCSMSSVSTRYEEVDRSGGDGLSVNASMKGGKNYFAAGKPKPLWGRLIEEDKVDAAKRSYSGQYLLSAGRNFLSKGHFAQTK